MPRNEDTNDSITPASLAFEYVSGTLRGHEREQVENDLNNDDESNDELRQHVSFWEEQLMAIHPTEQRTPSSDTWEKISSSIADGTSKQGSTQQTTEHTQGKGFFLNFNWANFWQWGAPTFAAIALMFVMFGYTPSSKVTGDPNTDYVAVLTDNEGKALLTALTAKDGKSMWLKWEVEKLNTASHAQLWAISKRDGETRPIQVLENAQVAKIDLDEATWRLVTDAAYLILTEEEEGGSAIDEPSEILLAKGVCVRFTQS